MGKDGANESEDHSWVVAAGALKDADGRPVRGCVPVAEAGLAEAEAKARAKELSGRALDGSRALFAPLELTEEGALEAASGEDWLSAKGVRERAVPYGKALGRAVSATEADGRPREVVAAVGAPPAAKADVAAAAAAVLIAAVAACAIALSPGAPSAPDPEPGPEPAASADAARVWEVAVTVSAEGVSDPSQVAVGPTFRIVDGEGAVVEQGGIGVGERASFDLEEGPYSFELLTAPVLSDGTTFRLPDAPLSFEAGPGSAEDGLTVSLERIDAADMTREQLEAVAEELEGAGASGAASDVRSRAEQAPSVAGSADEVVRDPAPAAPPAQGQGQGSSQGSSEPSSPSHTHSWVAQTSQQWVPNQVWVVDQPAWDEQIPYSVWKCLKCNITFGSKAEAEAHFTNYALQGDLSHNGTVLTEYNVVHHDEVGHYEDQGHYETVTTGYVCSGCGATK